MTPSSTSALALGEDDDALLGCTPASEVRPISAPSAISRNVRGSITPSRSRIVTACRLDRLRRLDDVPREAAVGTANGPRGRGGREPERVDSHMLGGGRCEVLSRLLHYRRSDGKLNRVFEIP
jgi:hypothetical protein